MMIDQVKGLADIVSIGAKKSKEGRIVEIKLAAVLSPGVAAELMDMQDNGKVVFQFERAVQQQRLPLAEVRPDDVPGQVNLFKTCPECSHRMELTASGEFACPECGVVEITADGEGAGASEASNGQADEGEEDAEEESGQTEAGPPGVESDELPVVDELAGLRCRKCGGEIEWVLSNSGPLLQCVECRHWMTEGEYRARTRRRRWRDPANGKVYEVSQGIGDGWGLFERKGRSSHRVRGVEYQHDRRAVERAAAEYAERHGWVETTDEEEEAAGGQESAEPELDPLDGEPVTREKGNPNTFPIRESEIGWILHNSAGDVNYAGHIPDLTDRELLFCLSREFRLSGRVQLKREIRRRLRQRESGEAPDPYPEWTARLRAALKKRSPEEAADDGRPFRPAAGE